MPTSLLFLLAGCLSPDASRDAALQRSRDTLAPSTRLVLVGVDDVDDLRAITRATALLGGEITGCFELARLCYAHFPGGDGSSSARGPRANVRPP